MKKALYLLICFIFVFSFSACGKKNGNTSPSSAALENSTTASNTEDTSNNNTFYKEDKDFTANLKRENGTVYVESTKHKNHLGYEITYAKQLFTVESGKDFEKYSIKNSDGYMLMETSPFEKPETIIDKIKKEYSISTEAESVINGCSWTVFLTNIDGHKAEIFVAYQNSTVYKLTVLYPDDTDNTLELSINDTIFSIVFNN